jgi:hypothetical protein
VTNVFSVTYIKAAMPDRGRTVLHVSPDTGLAESRTRALASIGYQVVRVETVVSALFEIRLRRCGILLLCHKLDHTGRCTLAESSQQNYPDTHIVAVLAHEHDHYPPLAHARVVFSQDPGPLVRVLRQHLSAAQSSLEESLGQGACTVSGAGRCTILGAPVEGDKHNDKNASCRNHTARLSCAVD